MGSINEGVWSKPALEKCETLAQKYSSSHQKNPHLTLDHGNKWLGYGFMHLLYFSFYHYFTVSSYLYKQKVCYKSWRCVMPESRLQQEAVLTWLLPVRYKGPLLGLQKGRDNRKAASCWVRTAGSLCVTTQLGDTGQATNLPGPQFSHLYRSDGFQLKCLQGPAAR
jgi:hypothetical protein